MRSVWKAILLRSIVAIALSGLSMACTTGPDVRPSDADADSSAPQRSVVTEPVVRSVIVAQIPASASVSMERDGPNGLPFIGITNCDVDRTGAHQSTDCVRAVTTAEELEVIEIGANGVSVPLQ